MSVEGGWFSTGKLAAQDTPFLLDKVHPSNIEREKIHMRPVTILKLTLMKSLMLEAVLD